MKLAKKILIFLSTIVTATSLVSCSQVDDFISGFGEQNTYFDFINENTITKISVQSMRDTGFKITVTEASAINNTRNLLEKSTVSDSKTELEADYKFEFHTREDVEIFYYTVGSDKGNFYNDDNIFTVSNRLDEGIMQNLSFIRKPKDFEHIYYESILQLLEKLRDNMDIEGYRIGVNINTDIDCLKYVHSIDLQNFIKDANEIIPNVEMVDINESDFDLILTLKNRGYDSTVYKTRIAVEDKKNHVLNNYYIVGLNESNDWEISVSEADIQPENW